MALGIWHFVAKSHINIKCVYSPFRNIVSDSTVHKALDTMTGSSLSILWDAVNDATKWGETKWCLILDNVQEYCPVYEGGIGRKSILKVGTAGTAIHLDNCKPGAFNLESYLSCIAQKERNTMTINTLTDDIDWPHLKTVQALHWACVLVNYSTFPSSSFYLQSFLCGFDYLLLPSITCKRDRRQWYNL